MLHRPALRPEHDAARRRIAGLHRIEVAAPLVVPVHEDAGPRVNGAHQRERVGNLGVDGRHDANEGGEKRRAVPGILPALMQFKGGLQRLKPCHVRNPFGDQDAFVHERGHQLLPPCKEKMLLVVGRLRGHGVHERLGVQNALARFDKERVGRGEHRGHDGRMGGNDRLVAERIEAVDQPLLLRRLDVQFGFLDGQHEGLARFRARLAELHEQQKALQRDKARALPLRWKGWSGPLHEVRHDAFQNGVAVGCGQAQLELGRAGHERAQFVIGCADDLGQAPAGLQAARLLAESRGAARSARTACAGMSPRVATTRRNNSEEKEIQRSHVREAGTRKKPNSWSALVWMVRRCASSANGSPSVASSSTKKRIVSASSSSRSNRAAKPICTARSVCCASGAALKVLAFGIEPFLDAAFRAEPRGMVMRIVGRKARHGGDAQDARGFIRRAAVKIVFGKTAHQTVTPEEQTPAPR